MLEGFENFMARGGSGIVIASQSGHRLPPLSAEQNKALATTSAEEFLALPMLAQVKNSLHAHQLSKHGNSLRVMAEAVRWGKRGARIYAINPGIITPLAIEGPAWIGQLAQGRSVGGGPSGHGGRSRKCRRTADRPRSRLHHRQRVSDVWRGAAAMWFGELEPK